MTDNPDELSRGVDISRRNFLGAVGAGTVAGTAGCLDFLTTGGDEPVEGGRPVVGLATAPDTLNPLRTSTAYSWAIIEHIYDFGTVEHPESGETMPHAIVDWELNEDNVDTDDPTIVAELREGMTWNDGEDVTAEDIAFTIEYIQEQEPAGTISAANYLHVEDVEAVDDHTVEYYLSAPDAAWQEQILGSIILPKHIWEDVDDYETYQPREADEGLVGSGPMELSEYDWESWFELEWRDEDEIWHTEHEWIEDGAPFIDAFRVEIFGSEDALEQSVLQGETDYPFLSFTVDNAVQAVENDDLEVFESEDDGWRHQSYNLRRVPFDCPAFRQLMVKLVDTKWIIDDVYEGIGAVGGTYATPKPYTQWRPPEPSDVSDYENVEVPDLSFLGDSGEGRGVTIDDVVNFLEDHDRAAHDYSAGPVEDSTVEADQELYVDGVPLSEAHTDNDGNDGQGPIVMSLRPPDDNPNEVRVGERTVEVMREAGIPAEQEIVGFNQLQLQTYQDQDFDVFMMGWSNIGWANDHYAQLYSSAGADLEGDSDAMTFNAMGYTGADDEIEAADAEMHPDARRPHVRTALAKIWSDAPTNICWHARVIQPLNNDWDGAIEEVGGIANEWTAMNLHLDE